MVGPTARFDSNNARWQVCQIADELPRRESSSNHNRAHFGEAHEMEAGLPNVDPDRRNFHEMPLLSVDHPHRQGRTIPLPYTPTNNGALTSPRNDDTGGTGCRYTMPVNMCFSMSAA
jgi:hypothetical protein